ncbi:hypothetical protein TWF718_005812 [Orbilia javanica]|uniref:N-acetyltransferase domain-containing protein n=1 Tax=Orbilia javanica TaxID=47235 RepID=A0AAN8MZI8_9PEZI
MSQGSQELSDLAFELFDHRAHLKREFISHAIRKGTGAWGKELDRGEFLLIERLIIGPAWRRKGVGKGIVSDIIDKARQSGRDPEFSLVRPNCLASEVERVTKGKTISERHEIKTRMREEIIAFWRYQGFRRIGASELFGLAADPNHPAAATPSAADFDLRYLEPDLNEVSPGPVVPPGVKDIPVGSGIFDSSQKRPWLLALLKEHLPPNYAAMTLPDNECVQFFTKFKADVTNKSYDWNKSDRYSENVLHIAAGLLKVKSIHWLLQNVNVGMVLSSHPNVEGYTPQEKFERKLDLLRPELRQDQDREFSGYHIDAIRCLLTFQGLNNPSEIQFRRLRFGCTCGSCLHGFVSPRMEFKLLYHAQMLHDLTSEDIENGPVWHGDNEFYTGFVPEDLRRRLRNNISLRQGFSNLFFHIAEVLRERMLPNAFNVSRQAISTYEWPPHTENYLQLGQVENALQAFFRHLGDDELPDEEDLEDPGSELFSLPECRNDYEFELVASACGFPGIVWGASE